MNTKAREQAAALFVPAYREQSSIEVNLDDEARARNDLPASPRSPLLDPTICQAMLDACHRRHGVGWSFGGYLEDRRELWRGSYLEASGSFVHLGVDINVAPGTTVVSPCAGRVLCSDDDYDIESGWGPRIIVEPADATLPLFVLAHLEDVSVRVGALLAAAEAIGRVGRPPRNGNWYPHLHVQTVARRLTCARDWLERLDGYGHPSRRDELKTEYPDPLIIVAADR